MCGIVGFTGQRNAKDVLIDGLKMLEYRGYDSAGMSLFGDGGIITVKKKGQVSVLEKNVRGLFSACGIGHTRWATHGKPNDINSHPHCYGDFCLVHNGIIENFAALKKELKQKGNIFASQTDSEVIAHLLQENFTDDIVQAIAKTNSMLDGSFALAVLHRSSPDKIFVTRRKSPLVVGKGDGENFVASDLAAFAKFTDKVLHLKDEQIAVVASGEILLFDGECNPLPAVFQTVKLTQEELGKGAYDTYMRKEIFENADVSRLTIDAFNSDKKQQAAICELFAKYKKIVFIGCGTAYHACLIGKYLFHTLPGLQSETELASEFRYGNPQIDETTLLIAVSQSGETADTLAGVRLAREKGAGVLAVCNVPNSALTKEADLVVFTKAGREVGVAATKSYVTQILVFYLIALLLTPECKTVKAISKELQKIPAVIEQALLSENEIKHIAKKVFRTKCVFFIGRNADFAIAREASLKLKEISYIFCDGFASGELKHGTLSLINKKTLVAAIVTQRAVAEKTLNALHEVKSRGGKILLLTQLKEAEKFDCDFLVRLPQAADILMPLVSIVPLQLLALHISKCKGLDPDKPRNLAKSVTVE